ncbi:MAG: AraC family ligand binding domain-containing protein, partial [Mesorhizobium sp.]|nr:AraC family ligand binding domain-containing protein [Mesorhizobium sp.]
MEKRTSVIESFHYVPASAWTRAAFSVLRAGKVAAGPDYRIERAVYPGQDILYCSAGAGYVETLGQRIDVGPGQLVWMANEAPHVHCADPRDPWTVLWFRLDGPEPAILESGPGFGPAGRWSILAAYPRLVFEAVGARWSIRTDSGTYEQGDDPLARLAA